MATASPRSSVAAAEVYGGAGFENEAVAYALDAETGAIEEGWPQSLFGLTVNVLPIVGRGVVTNPMLADLDFDGDLEISIDTISTQGWIFQHDGTIYKKMNNQEFGPLSDSSDAPAYILMNNGAFANIDNGGGIDLVKGTAGFDFALAFAGGGKRGEFDHHMSGWDTDTGKYMEGWPRVHDDWQFFNTPTVVDIDNDTNPEVIVGSGGYLVHAWNYQGVEPAGWPKQTGGWIIASVGIGDFDGDGLFDAAVSTRNGWLYVWRTQGAVQSIFEWNGFGANPHNTNNYEDDPTPYQVWDDKVEPPADEDPVADGDPATDTVDSPDTETPQDATDTTDAGKKPSSDDDCAAGSSGAASAWLLLALVALIVRRRRSHSADHSR